MSEQSVSEYLARMEAIQKEIVAALSDLTPVEMRYETEGNRPPLGRMMLRFAEHLEEHTTQLEGAREDAGALQTMPQRMLARAQEAYGGFLGAMVGLRDEDLDKIPEPGEWSPRQVLEHLISVHERYFEVVRRAREAAKLPDGS